MTNKHLIIKLEDVLDEEALKLVNVLEKKTDLIMKNLNLTVVGKCKHQFEPFGATIMYLLAESHCCLHTFWQEKEVYIDIFCCSDFNHELANQLFQEAFKANTMYSKVIFRGNLEIYNKNK